jgi:dethiobiotin synthetase
LLSLLALDKYQIPVKGVILNGPIDKENEKTLRKLNKAPILGQINNLDVINPDTLSKASSVVDLSVFFHND